MWYFLINTTRWIKVLSILLLLLLFSLACNAVFWSDDFVFYNSLQQQTLWEHMWKGYLTWDGRFVSLQAVVQALLIKYTTAPLAILFWSIMMLLLAVLYRLIIHKELNSNSGISAIIIFILLWYGFSFHLSETVYRVVGGFYMLSLVIAFGWIGMFINRPVYFSWGWLFIGFLLSILAGLIGVNGSVTLITFLLVSIVYDYPAYKEKQELLWYPATWGMALIAGTLISVLAPGNFIRASYHTSSFDFNIFTMVLSGIEIFARYSYYSLPAVGMALILAMIFPGEVIKSKGIHISIYHPENYIKIFKTWSFTDWMYELRWLLAGISSIVPVLAVPAHSGRRTSVFFMAFLFLWVVVFFHKLFYQKTQTNKPFFTIRLSARKVQGIIIIFLVFTMGLALQHYRLGRQIRLQIEAREAYFDSVRGTTDTVYVAPIVVDYIPFTYKFHDYLHKDYAIYHGFEAVILDSAAVERLPRYYIKPP